MMAITTKATTSKLTEMKITQTQVVWGGVRVEGMCGSFYHNALVKVHPVAESWLAQVNSHSVEFGPDYNFSCH